MSGCSVAIRCSRWRRFAILALAGILFSCFCLQPFSLLTLALAAPILCWLFWSGIVLYQRGPVAAGVSVQTNGQLNWWQSDHPGGQLLAGGVVSEFALLLRWQDQQHRRHQQWLLADQLSVADFRALARLLNQTNWQASGPGN